MCFRRYTNIQLDESENDSSSEVSDTLATSMPPKKSTIKDLPIPPALPSRKSKRDEACSEIVSFLRERRTTKDQEPVKPQNLSTDADELFCRSITENLRSLDAYQKATAKMYIMQILMEVQFKKVPSGCRPITPLELTEGHGMNYPTSTPMPYAANTAPMASNTYQMNTPTTSTNQMYPTYYQE